MRSSAVPERNLGASGTPTPRRAINLLAPAKTTEGHSPARPHPLTHPSPLSFIGTKQKGFLCSVDDSLTMAGICRHRPDSLPVWRGARGEYPGTRHVARGSARPRHQSLHLRPVRRGHLGFGIYGGIWIGETRSILNTTALPQRRGCSAASAYRCRVRSLAGRLLRRRIPLARRRRPRDKRAGAR